MRWIAALLTGAAAGLMAGTAQAAEDGAQAPAGAAFSDAIEFSAQTGLSAGPSLLGAAGVASLRYQPGQGLMRRTSGEAVSFTRPGLPYLDTVRFSTAAYDPLVGAALLRPGSDAGTGRLQAYDITYLRKWPSMLSLDAGRLNLDITPHAGLGLSSGGGRTAEAGALVRMMKAVGVAGEHAPRWYVYAGYRKRAMGLNLLRTEDAIRGDHLSDEGMAREIQAGVAAHRGVFHALLGYTFESVMMRSLGERARNDNRIGLNLSIR
jgi:hypothetical protein